MAVRIRNRFHREGPPRPKAVLASVVAMLAWKLAAESIRSMREVGYDIDLGRQYFDYVCEMLAFLAHCADRIAHRELEDAPRVEFTTALAQRLAEIVEDNRDMLLGAAEPGQCRKHFLDLFNRAGGEYADCDYGADGPGPDFGFRRCFAARVREGLPEKDRVWVYDQVMEIEVPEAIRALEKTLAGIFSAAAADATPRRGAALSGE